MTPAEVEILLEIYVCGEPPNPMSDYTKEVVKGFIDMSVVERSGKEVKTTELGTAWVKLICSTPLPITEYVDPRTKRFIK